MEASVSLARCRHERSAALLPLLEPRSIAIVGASEKPGSFGRSTLEQVLANDFPGVIYPVNPNQASVLGLACYPSLEALPGPVDLVILAVSNALVEDQLKRAVAMGCRAAVIFASAYLENDTTPALTERLAAIARAAGLPLCGANGMGFFHPATRTHATWYRAGPLPAGNVGLISHSGSLFLTLASNDTRLRYSLAVSPGQELVLTAADYMHYMLADGRTRALALFLETVRDPKGFVAALERAEAQDVPIIALKIGRTEASARLARSHSGALVGDDGAYEALFERHGVIRVRTVDELAATSLLLSSPRRAVKGGLGAVLDSGGARGLFMDLAHDHKVPFADINETTKQRLRERLDFGLDAVNPVDAWGTGNDATAVFRDCLKAVVDDPDTGLAILISDVTNDDDPANAEFAEAVEEVARQTTKPVLLGLHWSQHRGKIISSRTAAAGIPVLDGSENVLLAVKHAFAYRDFRDLPPLTPPASPPREIVARWQARLRDGQELDEAEALSLLGDFGLDVPRLAIAASQEEALRAAGMIGYPLAIKTAMPGIRHKSDVGGVRLGIASPDDLIAAYDDLSARLGPRVLLAQSAAKGVELALGLVHDAQFGPILMIGAGGVLIEVLRDRVTSLAPTDEVRAKRLLDRLSLCPLLSGYRGTAAADIERLALAIARFSVLARELGSLIGELDVNPLIVSATGAVAVDAILLPRKE